MPGDWFIITFNAVANVKKLTILTGSNAYKSDVIFGGKVEAGEESHVATGGKCLDYNYLGSFANGTFEAEHLQRVKCLRLTVTVKQDKWLLLREIKVFVDS